jgi:hypothetical protein
MAKYTVVYGNKNGSAHTIAIVIDGDADPIARARVLAGDGFNFLAAKELTWVEADVIESNSALFERLLDAETLRAKFGANRRAVRNSDNWKRDSEKSRRR